MTTLHTPPTGTRSITDGHLGTLPTTVLQHPSGARAEIALRGATLLSWTVPWRGETADLVHGYADEADLASQHGMRNALLFPFANRLRDDSYTFDGVTHRMGLQVPVDHEVIHGTARVLDWTVVEDGGATGAGEGAAASSAVASDDDAVSVTLTAGYRPGDLPGYPFSVDVTVTYTLTATSFDVVLTSRNVGDVDAPVAAGWHPYFRLPGHATIDGLSLRVPARAAVVTDAGLVPLAGDAAYTLLDADVVHPTLAGVSYDSAWDRLVPDADGRVRTRLTDPATGEGVAVWQETGSVLVFTSDSLSTPRASVAIEPIATMTDAFNRPEKADDVRLAVGTEKTFVFGVEVLRGEG